MIWTIDFLKPAKKRLKKLDQQMQKRILDFLYKRVLPTNEPRLLGKALTGDLNGYWSYRIGDYRVIADIQDDSFTIVAVSINHRREVYDAPSW